MSVPVPIAMPTSVRASAGAGACGLICITSSGREPFALAGAEHPELVTLTVTP